MADPLVATYTVIDGIPAEAVEVQYSDSAGLATLTNYTGTSVLFSDGVEQWRRPATIVAGSSLVRTVFQSGDLAVAGIYQLVHELTDPDGKEESPQLIHVIVRPETEA
jgi:hypothetical protein